MDIRNCDCFDGLASLATGSVDMVLTDLPYAITGNTWEAKLDLPKLMKEFNRIVKDDGIIVLFGSQPFTTDLINANRNRFRYTLVWEKPQATDFFNCRRKVLKSHEDILVFYKKLGTYNPQMVEGKPYYRGGSGEGMSSIGLHKPFKMIDRQNTTGLRYPKSVLKFTTERGLHTCQKPVPLLEWLIRTYSNEGDLVLDATFGSGSTAVACQNTGRRFVGFEINHEFYNVAAGRLGLTVTVHDGKKEECSSSKDDSENANQPTVPPCVDV